MKLTSIAATTTLIFFYTLNAHAQFDVTSSKWQPAGISIDGNDNEWQKPFHLYEANTGLLFAISNDNSNLYICLESGEKQKVHKLMKAGWTIELSAKDKKEKFDASISFPGVSMQQLPENKKEPMAFNATEGPKEKLNITEIINAYSLRLTTVTTKGFVSKNGVQPVSGANGIKVGVGADSAENIVFEVAIPLNELSTTDLFQAKELLLNVTVNALEKPSFEGNGNFNGGGNGQHHNGGGGGYGKGMGGGGSGYHQGQGNASFDRSTLFEKASFKQKFSLSKS